jgi:integrase
MSRAGLRCGEVCGLRWSDIDWQGKRLHVQRQAHHCKVDLDQHGKEALPKNGRKRWVMDLPDELLGALKRHEQVIRRLSMKRGWGACSQWVFPTTGNQPIDDGDWRRILILLRKRAGLDVCFGVHALRHTYAVLTLNEIADLQYVQRQLGHTSISITADLYGAGRNPTNPGVSDRLAAKVRAIRLGKMW